MFVARAQSAACRSPLCLRSHWPSRRARRTLHCSADRRIIIIASAPTTITPPPAARPTASPLCLSPLCRSASPIFSRRGTRGTARRASALRRPSRRRQASASPAATTTRTFQELTVRSPDLRRRREGTHPTRADGARSAGSFALRPARGVRRALAAALRYRCIRAEPRPPASLNACSFLLV